MESKEPWSVSAAMAVASGDSGRGGNSVNAGKSMVMLVMGDVNQE